MEQIVEYCRAFAAWLGTPTGIAVVGLVALLVVGAVRATPTPKDDRFVMRVAAYLRRIPVVSVIGVALERAFAESERDDGEKQ